jgi:hypothetical protein
MFACPETIVMPAGHDASSAVVETAVDAAGDVDAWLIESPDGDLPPLQAARATAPITAGTKVTFTTNILARLRSAY